jgi:hypothetical protein
MLRKGYALLLAATLAVVPMMEAMAQAGVQQVVVAARLEEPAAALVVVFPKVRERLAGPKTAKRIAMP